MDPVAVRDLESGVLVASLLPLPLSLAPLAGLVWLVNAAEDGVVPVVLAVFVVLVILGDLLRALGTEAHLGVFASLASHWLPDALAVLVDLVGRALASLLPRAPLARPVALGVRWAIVINLSLHILGVTAEDDAVIVAVTVISVILPVVVPVPCAVALIPSTMVRLGLPLGLALAIARFVPGLLACAVTRVISVKDESAAAGWEDDQIDI